MAGRFFKNNWTVTVIGGVLSVLLIRVIDWLFIDGYLWDGSKRIFWSIVDFFNTDYSVKLYFLILLPLLVLGIIIGILYLVSLKDKGGISTYPEWKAYTKDVFGDLQYRWQYDFYGKRYEITNLQLLCDQCSCRLVDLKCPVCNENYSYGNRFPSREQVLALISRNIDTGLYKQSKYFKE